MNGFMFKIEKFLDILINKGGYKEVITGLQNTMIIAVAGLLIGIVIGTLIATVRVMPKYKAAVRAMDKFCSFYVGLFRGTPMVVQLLVFYYVMLPYSSFFIFSVILLVTVAVFFSCCLTFFNSFFSFSTSCLTF